MTVEQRIYELVKESAAEHGHGGVITDWIVVYAQQRVGDDGNGITAVGTIIDDIPYHRLMGLLDYGLTMFRAEIAAPDEE